MTRPPSRPSIGNTSKRSERFVARRVSDPHLAADLTAEVFLAAIDAGRVLPGGAR